MWDSSSTPVCVKEAVLSSAIEGTVSSLSDLLLFERDETPGVPLEDVTEVSHCVAALDHATEMQRRGLPIANRLLRETHRILLSHSRGAGKAPGEYRRSGGAPAPHCGCSMPCANNPS